MALDFPNSPTVGATYTSGGFTWQWDGAKWVSQGEAPGGLYLPLAGGTLTGPLNVNSPTSHIDNANIGANAPGTGAFTTLTGNTINVNQPTSNIDNAVIGGVTPGVGTFTNLTATSLSASAIAANTIDSAVIGSHTPAAGNFTTLSATGNATFGGTVNISGAFSSTGQIYSGSNIFAANAIYPSYTVFPNWYMAANGTLHYTQHLSGYYSYWNSNGGTYGWVSNNNTVMSIDASGNFNIAGNLVVPGNGTLSGTFTMSYLQVNGTAVVSGNSTCNGNFNTNQINGTNIYGSGVVNAGSTMTAGSTINGAQLYLSSNLGVNYSAWSGYWLALNVSGNGMYVNLSGSNYGAIILDSYSDERIKDIAGPSPYGLKEILATEPIIYTYKGNHSSFESKATPDELEGVEQMPPDTTTVHVGISAQKQEKIIPEMIQIREGFIDGEKVDDLRGFVYHEWITYALVNAVKELNKKIEMLERRR